MPDEQTQIAESKLSARAAELKQRLLESRMKSVERAVKADPASIDELIRKNSGGMDTPTATDQDVVGLVDKVLKHVVHSPKPAPPTATRPGMTTKPSNPASVANMAVVDRAVAEPARPIINTSPDVVMADATNRDKSHQSTPAPAAADASLARRLEQDEDLRDWLALTNYHDVESRNKRLEVYRERHREKIRKVQALEEQMKQMEAERRKLMEEVEPDMGFLWPTTASLATAPAPSSVVSTPTLVDPAATLSKESTEVKGEHSDTVPAKRMLETIPTEPSYRPEKHARVDEKYSHAGRQTSIHRDKEQGEIDEGDSHRKDAHQSTSRPYIKSEDGRRVRESPPRRARDWSPHASPTGRRFAAEHRGPRRPDWNEHKGQDNGSYRRETETARRPLGRNGPPTYFDVGAKGDTRYFIVKSWTDENVYRCMEEGIWVTQQHNEALLNRAFTQTKNVILFFSANQSKAFQGYARMISPTSPNNPSPRWINNLNWACSNPFRVRWLSKIEVEFYRIGHLKNSLNEGQAVLVGKDGQEIEETCGADLLHEMFAIAQDKYDRRDASLSFRNQ